MKRQNDSWYNDIFYTNSAYEMKNLLMRSKVAWRIVICTEEETTDGKTLYAAVGMENDLVHLDIEGKLYGWGFLKPNVGGTSRVFWCPKNIDKTEADFRWEFEENYGGDVNNSYYETKNGWIMDEDSTEESKKFCAETMKGRRLEWN